MPITPPTPSLGGDEEVAPAVAVARTVGGLALLLVGIVLAAAGAFGYFIVPFIAPFQGGFWNTLWDLDFLAAILGGIGLVLMVVGGAIMRRARKRDLQITFGSGELGESMSDIIDSAAPGETRTGTAPPTIL